MLHSMRLTLLPWIHLHTKNAVPLQGTSVRFTLLSMVNNPCIVISLIAIFFVVWFYSVVHESPDDIISTEKGFDFVAVAPVPFFRRFDGAKHLDCAAFFEKRNGSKTPARVKAVNLDAIEIDMSCPGILKRNYFTQKALSPEEASFPLAFARVVYKDYLFLEADLASIYAPQNAYCFSIDSKADSKFKKRIHALSKCFPNVYYTWNEYSVDSAGHNMDTAHLACVRALRSEQSWKYVVLLQNYDSAIKTNAEMVQIYRWLGGANDLELNPPFMERINNGLDWTFKGLNLFKNSSKNTDRNITFAKGYNECSLSRAAVNYIFDELNINKLVSQLNSGSFGIDEILLPTLQADDAIGLPGGITHRCIDEGTSLKHYTRKSIWGGGGPCISNQYRHGICILGTEHLPEIESWPELFGNKFYPEMDYGAFECMRERLFNRTYGANRMPPEDTLDELEYKTNPTVRYNRERRRLKFDKSNFKCKNYGRTG